MPYQHHACIEPLASTLITAAGIGGSRSNIATPYNLNSLPVTTPPLMDWARHGARGCAHAAYNGQGGKAYAHRALPCNSSGSPEILHATRLPTLAARTTTCVCALLRPLLVAVGENKHRAHIPSLACGAKHLSPATLYCHSASVSRFHFCMTPAGCSDYAFDLWWFCICPCPPLCRSHLHTPVWRPGRQGRRAQILRRGRGPC